MFDVLCAKRSAGTQSTPEQIELIELIISELTTNIVMEAGRLYERPFLDSSPQGPEGLFAAAKADRLVQVLDEIRRRAAASSTRKSLSDLSSPPALMKRTASAQ